jgi:hypothetical protein
MRDRHRTLVVDASQLRTCRLEIIVPNGMLVVTVDTLTETAVVTRGELPPETMPERFSTELGEEVE